MKVTNIVNIDLSIRQNIPFVDAVQGDSARAIEFRLFDKGQPFNVPDGSAALIRYKRPDGYGGVYDTLPNGETAYSISTNKVIAVLSPTALGVAGNVDFQITVSNGEDLISAFALEIRVDADPSADVLDAEDYINISQFVTEESKKNAPYIGENGNWLIGGEDTGVSASGKKGDKGDKGDTGQSGVYVGSGEMPGGYNVQVDPTGETPVFVQTVNGQAPDDSGNVEIPTGGSELQPLTFTGAVEVTYDGTTPVTIDIPAAGGGGVDPTEAEKIVEYTVTANTASTTKFVFTASDYPKLAQYNHLRGIYKTPTNVSWPWTQIFVNNTVIAKQSGNSTSMALFDILRHGEIFDGSISAYTNPSNYNAWTKDNQAFRSSMGSLLPKKLGALTSIAIGSYQAFLSEGSTIEIWGWNE